MSATPQLSPIYLFSFYTGRLFTGLTTLALLTNWFFSLFGRGCLGGFIKTAAILVLLLFLSGFVTALLVAWLNATGKIA